MKGTVGYVQEMEQLLPTEKHTAESKWQFCNCETCQRRRRFIDRAPGGPIDYPTYRRKDERY